MHPTDLCYAPATELLERFRAGTLTPVEVLEVQIARIEQHDAALHSISSTRFATARAAAAASGLRYREGSERPLEGITVAVKEEQPIQGEVLRLGSVALGDGVVSERSHPLVERLEQAGAVVHVRTTTPEFCAAGFTQSRLWGVTRSAWQRDHAAGGSSGGTGAALAAGFATLGTGSDIAGSLRIPAAANGVVGYKSPYGSVPAMQPTSLDTYCHDGGMARNVRDVVLLHGVIAGQHPLDLVSLPERAIVDPVDAGDLTGLTIARSRTLGDHPVGEDCAAGLAIASAALEAAGARVVDVDLDWSSDEIARAAFAHFGSIMAPMIRDELGDAYERSEAYTRDFVEASERALAEVGPYGAIQMEARVQRDLARVLASADALICPTATVPALLAEHEYLDHVVEVDGVASTLVHHLQSALTIPFNLASRLPVLAVPSGRATTGVPTSVQVVGRAYDESGAARVAHVVEQAAPWYADDDWRPRLGQPAAQAAGSASV